MSDVIELVSNSVVAVVILDNELLISIADLKTLHQTRLDEIYFYQTKQLKALALNWKV